MRELVVDLGAEQERLDVRLRSLPDRDWEAASAAEGWSVRDCVSHLAQFEDDALRALRDPHGFAERVQRATDDPAGYLAAGLDRGRSLSPDGVRTWWRDSRSAAADELGRCDPRQRVPWFGPSMSARSCATARLMETWAHGLDVFDVTGGSPAEGDQLRHVALLGCLTRVHSYRVRGLEAPAVDVRVEVDLPSGAPWSHGPAGAEQRVRGSVGEFCAVVTQRRHVDDTALVADGDAAVEWLHLAQAFAGAPTSGPSSRRAVQL